MRGWFQPRDPVRDTPPRHDWILFLIVVLIAYAVWTGLR